MGSGGRLGSSLSSHQHAHQQQQQQQHASSHHLRAGPLQPSQLLPLSASSPALIGGDQNGDGPPQHVPQQQVRLSRPVLDAVQHVRNAVLQLYNGGAGQEINVQKAMEIR